MQLWDNMKHRKKKNDLDNLSVNLCSEIMQPSSTIPVSTPRRRVPLPNAPDIDVDLSTMYDSNFYRSIGQGVKGFNELDMDQIMKKFEEMQEGMEKLEKEIQHNQNKLLDHLMEVGWVPNYKYIEQQKHKEAEIFGRHYNPDDVDMEALVAGKYKDDYHLISRCESYTVRIQRDVVAFWQKDPEWICLTEQKIEKVQFYDKGVKLGAMKIELEG